jgi:hypothetical protein
MTKRTYAALLSIGLGCLPLVAQTPAERSPFEASLATTLATADTKKLSSGSNPTGYLLGLGYRMEHFPGLGSRIHLGFMSFSGKEGSGLENKKRPQLHFGWDFMKEYGRLSVFGGLTGTQWKQSVTASNPDFTGANRAEGIKMGARVGAEYVIGNGFSAQVTFEQTEFNRKFNPSWVGIGAVYRFRNE